MAGLKMTSNRFDAHAKTAAMSLPEMAYRYVLSWSVRHTLPTGPTIIQELESTVASGGAGPLPPESIDRVRDIEISDDSQLKSYLHGQCVSRKGARR